MFSLIQKWLEFVKFSHTVFALPFALAAMVVAARETRGWPGWRVFVLIIAAMACARTCAMAFNRIADRKFDAVNPRTSMRHLPARKISLRSAIGLWLLSGAGFITVSYFINSTCFYLSPIAIAIICFYSLTKRFTDYTHVYLGIAVALAPIGAWLAVRGSFHYLALVLAVGVVFWLIGFDLIYATQDYEFDRKHGLHSLVVAWGINNALRAATLAHLVMWGSLAVFGLLARFRIAYFVGLFIILVSLIVEHWLARKRSLKWVNIAFFRLNALISVVFLICTVVEVVFPGFRFKR